jgi:hypothetical protein
VIKEEVRCDYIPTKSQLSSAPDRSLDLIWLRLREGPGRKEAVFPPRIRDLSTTSSVRSQMIDYIYVMKTLHHNLLLPAT